MLEQQDIPRRVAGAEVLLARAAGRAKEYRRTLIAGQRTRAIGAATVDHDDFIGAAALSTFNRPRNL